MNAIESISIYNEEKLISVKEYAAEKGISTTTVYDKIHTHEKELTGHIFIQNGRQMLDEKAQELLAPSRANAPLIKKAADLENALSEKANEAAGAKNAVDSLTSDNKKMKNLIAEKDKQVDELKEKVSELQDQISTDKEHITAQEKQIYDLINELNSQAEFKNRLDALFSVLEKNANTSLGQKLGNLLFSRD